MDEGCQCNACRADGAHLSSCAVHNAPSYPVGECDCGLTGLPKLVCVGCGIELNPDYSKCEGCS